MRSSVDHVLLSRVLRALGLSALSVVHPACDSLSERREPEEPAPQSDTQGSGSRPNAVDAPELDDRDDPPMVTGRGGSPALGGAASPAAGGAGADTSEPPDADADAGVTTSPLRCPPEIGLDDFGVSSLLAMQQCGSQQTFVQQVVCVAHPGFDGQDKPQSCQAGRPPDECLLRLYSCGLQSIGDVVMCGPVMSQSGECCYVVGGQCPVGNP